MAGTKQTVSQRKTGKHLYRESVEPTRSGEDTSQARKQGWSERAKGLQEGLLKTRGEAGSNQGLSAPSIVVHAEKISPTFWNSIDIIGKRVEDAEAAARLAKDYLVDNRLSYRMIFIKDGKVVGYRFYPEPSAYLKNENIDISSLEDVNFDSLKQNIEKLKADGYYVVENRPTEDVSEVQANIDEHIRIAKAIPGYIGGIVLGMADKYGELQIKSKSLGDVRLSRLSEGVSFKTKKIPDPAPQDSKDYGVLYTVLNEHQELIDNHVATPLQMTKISSAIARAEKSVLLIYKKIDKVVGVQEIPQSLYMKGKTFEAYAKDQAKKYAASGLVAIVNTSKAGAAMKTFRRTLENTNLDMVLAAQEKTGEVKIVGKDA